jgi:hypothetical protein
MIPGRLLQRLAEALCSVDMRERVIEAVLADCQHEWLNARTPGNRVAAVAKCWLSFWAALAGCLAHDMRHDAEGSRRESSCLPDGRASGRPCASSWSADDRGSDWQDRRGRVRAQLMIAYFPALAIWFYRNKFSRQRSWAGLAWSLGLMLAFLAGREMFSEFRFILGWAAGSCVAASWTFLVRKETDEEPAGESWP